MGPVSAEYFVFALNSTNQAPQIIERGQLAVSTVPFEQAEQVRMLGRHHRVNSIRWSDIPFATRHSTTLGIPVPEFALTVRELRVEQSTSLGSHTFFVARILDRHVYSDQPEFHRIHGLYAACRRKDRVSMTP
jgi:flavin reductase (DIM6/NTAB) family NADH-FMN oxidoreductase RutF